MAGPFRLRRARLPRAERHGPAHRQRGPASPICAPQHPDVPGDIGRRGRPLHSFPRYVSGTRSILSRVLRPQGIPWARFPEPLIPTRPPDAKQTRSMTREYTPVLSPQDKLRKTAFRRFPRRRGGKVLSPATALPERGATARTCPVQTSLSRYRALLNASSRASNGHCSAAVCPLAGQTRARQSRDPPSPALARSLALAVAASPPLRRPLSRSVGPETCWPEQL